MIKLSNRLMLISKFIDKNDIVVDIGCDHALLDIYLALKYKKKYYASDIRENALNNARENIKKNNLEDSIVIRCGDGLETICDDDSINTVVISGMGFQTIINILKNTNKLSNINKLVIESNSYPEKVRKHLVKNGFYIDSEDVVKDKNIYYVVTCYKRGKVKYSKSQLEIGIFKNSNISIDYIKNEMKKTNIIFKLVPITDFIRRYKLRRKIFWLNKKKNSSF